MVESRDGTMWMATAGAGLLKYDRRRNRLVRYRNHPEDNESLGADSVTDLYEDREGEMWVDLHKSTPYFFSENPPPFQNFTHQRGGLKGSLVTSIYEDRNNILWIGSTGGLNRIDRASGKNTVPPGVGVKGEVLSILEDRSGTLVAGTFRQGLQRLNPSTGQAESYHRGRDVSSNQDENPIMRMFIDRLGTLWAATWGGLRRFDSASGNFTTFKPDPQGEVDYSDIKEDVVGNLWLYEEDLILRVTDNGKGVSTEIADGGRQGHFGLRGMRERADRIGGKFALITSQTSGTQITLRIPGYIIFQRTGPTAHTPLAKLRALLGRFIS